jgi:hypothetical protein
MTTFQSSKFLSQLLTNLVMGLSQLNNHDPALTQVVAKLNNYRQTPELNGPQLLNDLKHAKELISSYGIHPKKKTPSQDMVIDLPTILYNTIEEVDHLIIKEQVMDKISVERRLTAIWNKLATYRLMSR